jgi:dethiobiotin synthetase
MGRPDRVVLVTGTGTEVGKTWVTARVAASLRAAGVAVAARKPAQSYDPQDDDTDASILAEATGTAPEVVCPPHRWYPVPLAPPMAADVLGRPSIALADLVDELHWPEGTVLGFVEGAGGLCSPLAHDGDTLSLVARLQPDLVILVADPALGVVSNVRLASRALAATGEVPLLVVLNRYDETDDVHRLSHEWLRRVDGLTVETDLDDAVEAVLHHSSRPVPPA